ncbi:MAG: YceI family protein [Arenicella sp.]|nr:YceI family protein [Arenicella sp.]
MNFIKAIALFVLICVSAYGNAETIESPTTWILDSANSRVNFTSIKKGNIGESHAFTDLSGIIAGSQVSIIIKPDSVESRVPIRNERMRELLFETGLYPTIEVSANVAAQLADLKSGGSLLATVPSSVSMHGVSNKLDLELRISKLSNKILIVSSTQPVIVRATDYNMVDGIGKLSALVNNLAIAESVPVSFSLQFILAE